jgi:hypothetical protein
MASSDWGSEASGAPRSDRGGGFVVGVEFQLHALRCEAQAVEPVQGIANLVCLEAVGAELAAQLFEFGAGIAAPIVFVDKNKHFEHEPNIAHECASQASVLPRMTAHEITPLAPGRRCESSRPLELSLRFAPCPDTKRAIPSAQPASCRAPY